MISYKELDIGQKLKKIREDLNLKREFVSAKLKITSRALGDIENGKTSITVERLIDLLNIYKKGLDSVFDFAFINNFSPTVTQNSGNKGTYISQVQGNLNDTTFILELLNSKEELIREKDKRLALYENAKS